MRTKKAPSHGLGPRPTRRARPAPAPAVRWPWTRTARSVEADPRLEAAFFEALRQQHRAPRPPTSVDAAVDALIAAGAAASSSSSTSPPALDPSPWAVAHTSGLLGWRAFSGRRALASQAIDLASGTVLSRAEALGGRLLSSAAGTCAARRGSPRTLDVSVTRVEVGPGPRSGGRTDGAGREVGGGGGGRTEKGGWAVRLPVKGTGAVEVLYAGRDVRVLRGAGGVAVQVRPEALLLLEG